MHFAFPQEKRSKIGREIFVRKKESPRVLKNITNQLDYYRTEPDAKSPRGPYMLAKERSTKSLLRYFLHARSPHLGSIRTEESRDAPKKIETESSIQEMTESSGNSTPIEFSIVDEGVPKMIPIVVPRMGALHPPPLRRMFSRPIDKDLQKTIIVNPGTVIELKGKRAGALGDKVRERIKQEFQNQNELFKAVSSGNYILCSSMLHNQKGINLEFFNHEGKTPLHVACLGKRKAIVELLLRLGANVNARTLRSAITPLHCAFRSGSRQIAQILVNYGGSLTSMDAEGNTPVHYFFRYCQTQSSESDSSMSGIISEDPNEIEDRSDFLMALEIRNKKGLRPQEMSDIGLQQVVEKLAFAFFEPRESQQLQTTVTHTHLNWEL